jgi:actin-related protein
LPDGTTLKLGAERSKAPEILFNPSLIGLEYPGIHEMVTGCIQKCDIDLRKTLYGNIIVAGSTTLMSMFCERLHKQI